MNTIIKHLFIPYELAVMAKEKGFDEKCLGYWVIENYYNEKEGTFHYINRGGFYVGYGNYDAMR